MDCCLLPFLALEEERQTILGQKKEGKRAFYYIRKSANKKKTNYRETQISLYPRALSHCAYL